MAKGGSRKQGSGVMRSKELEEKLKSVENRIRNRKTEKAVILDSKGNILFEKSGGKTSVSFTPQERVNMSGETLTHNHPEDTDTTFSSADILTAVRNNSAEMRAVSSDKTVSLVIGKNSILKSNSTARNKFIADYQAIWDNANREIDRLNAAYKANPIDYSAYVKRHGEIYEGARSAQHAYMRKNQSKFAYTYSERG